MKKLMLLGLLTIGGSLFAQAQVSDSFVLATIEGKSVTVADLKKYVNENFPNQSGEPVQIWSGAFEIFINQKLNDLWAEKTGIKQKPEFQARVKELQSRSQGNIKLDENFVASEFMTKEVENKIKEPSETELKAFYETHKNRFRDIKFTKIKVQIVSFDNRQDAQSFFNKIRGSKQDLAELAKAEGRSVVSAAFGYDEKPYELEYRFLRALTAIKINQVAMYSFGNSHKVYKVTERIAPEAEPFEKVKNQVKQQWKITKLMELYPQFIEELKKEFKIDDAAGKKYFAAEEQVNLKMA